MYEPANLARVHDLIIRGLKYRMHSWGDPNGLPVFLLHGWADVGMSFQFVADYMDEGWYLLAPDWRGFGDTQWQSGGYWFPDYLADLDALIDHYSPLHPVRLVGHSMGGNVAWLYAGIRPKRVSHAVSLDVYGLPESSVDQAPAHYAKWLDQVKKEQTFSGYTEIDNIIERIITLAPNIGAEKARFLASHWCDESDLGTIRLKHDPAHKRLNPILYRRSEARSCWREISAKGLLVLASESLFYQRYEKEGYQTELNEYISLFTEAIIRDTGHMLHLEQPERLAAILDDFLKYEGKN